MINDQSHATIITGSDFLVKVFLTGMGKKIAGGQSIALPPSGFAQSVIMETHNGLTEFQIELYHL